METIKKFHFKQLLPVTQLNEMQGFVQESIDHVVHDGLTDEMKYTGFTASKSSQLEVSLAPGRVFDDGSVYALNSQSPLNLLEYTPLATNRIVAIAASVHEADSEATPLKVVINADDNLTQTQALPTERHRNAVLNIIAGLESAAPQKPTVETNLLVICWVWLDNAQITKIEMNADGLLPSVKQNNARLNHIENWREDIGQRVQTLGSDITSLASGQSNTAQHNIVMEMAADIALLKEISEQEEGQSSYGADRFLFDDESDITNPNYLARIEEGIRFSYDGEDEQQIEVGNQYDDSVKISNAFLLPDYVHVPRIAVGNPTGSVPISQYDFQTVDWVQKTLSRSRIRYGATTTVCTNSSWWRSGSYNSTTGIFRRGGETWQYIGRGSKSRHYRLRKFWYDTWEELYWDAITNNHSISGSMCAQTFLNSQDTWMVDLKLRFDQVGPSGDVTVILTETKHGKPDLENALMSVTIPHSELKTGGEQTKVVWPATFLSKGKHYGLCFVTGGSHHLASTNGVNYGQGTFFYSTDGVFFQGDLERDICFEIGAAQFKSTRLEVNLNPLSLGGGISDIDILAELAIPEGTDIRFEIQPSGGAWAPLDEVINGNHALHGLPALCYFRAVFIGTRDVMPGINLAGSSVKLYRPRTTGKHISTPYQLLVPTQEFKVVLKIEEFYEDNHNMTVVLNDVTNSVNGVAPAAITDRVLSIGDDENHKNIERTFTWTATELTSPTSEVTIETDFSTTSPLDTFHGSERVHLAF